MFLRFIHIAACISTSFLSPFQVLFINKSVFFLYPFMWLGERLPPHISFSLCLLTTAVYQTPPSRSPLCICHQHVTQENTEVFFFIFTICMCVCVFVFKDLFIYFWLRWVSLSAWAFSTVASGATLGCGVGLLRWLLSWSTGSRHMGFSGCGSGALEGRPSGCGTPA